MSLGCSSIAPCTIRVKIHLARWRAHLDPNSSRDFVGMQNLGARKLQLTAYHVKM